MKEKKSLFSNLLQVISPLAAGLLLTVSFPKPAHHYLAWLALLPLLVCLRRAGFKEGFRLGFIAGLAHYFTLLYWVLPFLQTFAYFPFYLALPVHFLFAAFLGLYIALFSGCISRCCSGPIGCLVLVPVFWVALEYLRTFLFSGFPWELLGASQYHVLPLIQISDIVGVYGISFIVAAVNAALVVLTLFVTRLDWHETRVKPGRLSATLLVTGALIAGTWLYGQRRIEAVDASMTRMPQKKITVVQGNVEQHLKWDPQFQKSTTEKYVRLSAAVDEKPVDMVVWPETATPFYFPHDTELAKVVQEAVIRARSSFLIGSPAVVFTDGQASYYNSAFLVSPRGMITGRYDKVHLVPFGEYVPEWLPFMDKIVIHAGDFSTGEKGRILEWGEERVGALICYEVIFPELARAMTGNGATLLINITNDAWYGLTGAPYQHFSQAVLRAVENRRALVRSANTGFSGFIDPVGRIQKATGLYKEAVVSHGVPMMRETTFYTRHGDWFAQGCLAAACLVVLLRVWQSIKNRDRRAGPLRGDVVCGNLTNVIITSL